MKHLVFYEVGLAARIGFSLARDHTFSMGIEKNFKAGFDRGFNPRRIKPLHGQ